METVQEAQPSRTDCRTLTGAAGGGAEGGGETASSKTGSDGRLNIFSPSSYQREGKQRQANSLGR